MSFCATTERLERITNKCLHLVKAHAKPVAPRQLAGFLYTNGLSSFTKKLQLLMFPQTLKHDGRN